MIIEIAGQQWQVHKVKAHHPGVMEENVCELFAIYAGPMCLLCTLICQELFPEVRLRPWYSKPVEARV